MTSLNQGKSALDHQLILQRETAKNFFWHRLRWQALQRLVASTNPKTFVDVGAGSGLFSQFVRRDYPSAKYFFIEPSQTLAPILEQEFGKESNVTHQSSLPGVDVFLLLDVLEHVENDKKFIEDLVNKMPSGSRLLLTVPASDALWSRWDTAVGHLRRYSKESLLNAFSTVQDKIEIDFCQYLFWELFPLGLYRKWKLNRNQDKIDSNSEAEVPVLPKWINEGLYAYGKVGLTFAKWFNFGTSLALCAKKK